MSVSHTLQPSDLGWPPVQLPGSSGGRDGREWGGTVAAGGSKRKNSGGAKSAAILAIGSFFGGKSFWIYL